MGELKERVLGAVGTEGFGAEKEREGAFGVVTFGAEKERVPELKPPVLGAENDRLAASAGVTIRLRRKSTDTTRASSLRSPAPACMVPHPIED